MQEALDRLDGDSERASINKINILEPLSIASFQVDNRIIAYVDIETIIYLFF
jgi:hypothetical protein